MTKIVCISDTHGYHRRLDIPDGDILIHAGDIDPVWGSIYELMDFLDWLGELPHKYKVFIAGNHDLEFESKPMICQELIVKKGTGIYLENIHVVLDGVKIFGSPYQVPFVGAFNVSDSRRKTMWKQIQDDTDIVITHNPPFGILDGAWRMEPDSQVGEMYKESVGDPFLTKRLEELKPKLSVFGHIHESYGKLKKNGTTYVNAAISNGNRLNDPIVVNI